MLYNLLDGMFCDVDMHMERSSGQAGECSLYSRGGLFDVAVLRDEDSVERVTHSVKNADSGPQIPKVEEVVPKIGFFNFDGECFIGSDGGYEQCKEEITMKASDETKETKNEERGISRELSAFPVTVQAQTRALQPLLQAVHGGLYAAVLVYEGHTQHHSLPYAEIAAKNIRNILMLATERSNVKSMKFCKKKQTRKFLKTENSAPKIYVFDVQVCLTFADLNMKLKDVLKTREEEYQLETGEEAVQDHT